MRCPPRAIALDLDGTLLDTETIYAAAFHQAMRDTGFAVRGADYGRLIGLPTGARLDVLRALLGPGFPVLAWKQRYYARRNALLESGVPLRDGALALLDDLESRGVACALATSASRATALRNLRQAGLSGRFGRIVARDDVRRPKPAPDSFLRAAALLGVAPAGCLALEDSEPGLLSALGAGLHVIAVPQVRRSVPPGCRAVARDLHQARVLIAEWLERPPSWNVQPAA